MSKKLVKKLRVLFSLTTKEFGQSNYFWQTVENTIFAIATFTFILAKYYIKISECSKYKSMDIVKHP